ncbi:MAG: ABC transporter substrate-binding protein [Thermoplasmata archaeon]
MNKKLVYGVIAVVIVIILVIGVLEIMPSSAYSITESSSSSTANAGQSITFTAFISGGTPSSVVFNFGDGSTGSATLLSGSEYTATHAYSYSGRYLVIANATINGKYVNTMNNIIEVNVVPATITTTVSSQLTQPSIITQTLIYSAGSNVTLIGSILQPPTDTNWSVGYYIWNFGDGATAVNPAIFNTSSGNIMPENISHRFSTPGIYAVSLGVITFNSTDYVQSSNTINGINYTYYPVSDLATILSSNQYHNNTYVNTIIVTAPGQTAQIKKSTQTSSNANEIIVTQVVPGGPFSFDPAITPGTTDLLPVANVYETLIADNGSSSTTFVPVVAKEIPSVSNGEISANGLNYTFYIRSGLKFANGDPVTAWDAYTSFVRLLLFTQGVPSTDGFLLAADLLPGEGYAPGLFTNGTALYQNITEAVTVNNSTQSITFHLVTPDPIFLQRVALYWDGCIMDYNWLVAHGAGITFTPAGFLAYTAYGNQNDYNNYIRYNMMGSGPYMVKSYLVGQSIILVPNPDFTPIPGVLGYDHPVNNSVYIQWEKDASTALLMAESGQTDIVYGLPNYDYPIISHMAAEGKFNITTYPTISTWFYVFNTDINTTMLSSLGVGYSIPYNYFANQDVRLAFAYAFNYTNYINNLLGNMEYGANFGFSFEGAIPEGMPGYLNNTQLKQAGTSIPYYDLTKAKQYMMESGFYNQTINMPIIVWAGDPIDFAAAQDWASTINSIDPNIHINAMYLEYDSVIGYQVPGQNPMPLYLTGWNPPWNYPTATITFYYQEGNYLAPDDGWSYSNFESWGYTAEANEWENMQNLINNATITGNETLSLKYFDQADEIAVNMSLIVNAYQETGMLIYSSSISGAQYEENPTIAGGGVTLFFYLSKG